MSIKLFWENLPQSEDLHLSAEKVAKEKWIVDGAMVFGENYAYILDYEGWHECRFSVFPEDHGGALLKILCEGCEKVLTLGFRPRHPSGLIIRGLARLEIIEFDLEPEPFVKEAECDLSAYLFLKRR